MSTLLLLLSGPQQAWGSRSRFARRETEREPTKSGVLGLVAAAQGRRRTDPLDDLWGLQFAVRVDQEGTLQRDFQTAHHPNGKSMPLTHRYFLADAVFVAAIEGPDAIVSALDHAVRQPAFPLYLGRRAFPPGRPVALGMRDCSVMSALEDEPWRASEAHQRRTRARAVSLRVRRDAEPDETGFAIRDVPLSFDPVRRDYGWRQVVEPPPLRIFNPHGRDDSHEPLAELGG